MKSEIDLSSSQFLTQLSDCLAFESLALFFVHLLNKHLDVKNLAIDMEIYTKNKYLFETTRYTAFTPRRIQQIVKEYSEIAEIEQKVHPHLFRHQMITYLTSQGLSDGQIQLISGHESKKSLEIYQHLSLKNVEQDYQGAVREILL